MKVLIIGGTRFIGLHLVRELLERDHEIFLFNRGITPNPFTGDVLNIIGDRKKTGSLRKGLGKERFDIAIDMIAYNADEMRDAIETLEGRVEHYLFISTRSVYDQDRLKYPIRENEPTIDDPSDAYGYNKRQAELILLRAYEEKSFPGTILRLPAVYGPHDYQAREWYFIRRILDGREHMLLPNFGFSVYHREYAGNIAEQLSFLMTKQESIGQVYNSGHINFQSYKDLVRLAAKLIGADLYLYGVLATDIPWKVPLTEPLLHVSSTAKLENLGYKEPYDLRAGLKETIKYFKEHPVKKWIFSERQKIDMFDYNLEDKLIAEIGVRIGD